MGLRRLLAAVTHRTSVVAILTIGSVLIFLGAALTYGLWKSRQVTLLQTVDNAGRVVQLMQADATRLLETASLTLSTAAFWIRQHPDADLRTNAEFTDLVREHVKVAKAVRSLNVALSDGTLVAIPHPSVGTPPVSIADREHFTVWLGGDRPRQPYIGRPVKARAETPGEWILPITLRVDVAPGRFYVLSLALRLADIADIYRSIIVRDTDSAGLFRSDGVLLMRIPFVDKDIGRDFSRNGLLFKALANAPRGVLDGRVIVDGSYRLGAYARVPNSDLVVAFSQDRDAVLAEWRDDARFYATAFLIVGCIIAAMGVFLVRLLLRDEHRARLQRDALAAAEAGSRAKSSFLAAISHELRTPLNAINGFSELLTHQVFGPLGSAKYREYAADILRSGGHLLKLIDELLDAARIEAGKVELRPEPFDLKAEIEACLSLVRLEAARKNVTLRVDCPPLEIVADRQAVRRILVNLLGNAVKFTERGHVAVTVARSAGPSGAGEVAVSVADTGIGIPADQLAVLGRPFVQVRSSTLTRVHEGSGLGLAISKGLATALGGSLTMASDVGRGTTVVLRIPTATAASVPPPLTANVA